MTTALILDTETTGFESPEVIELAYMGPLDSPLEDAPPTCLRFKPTKPISLGAMATHHIIAEDLEACDPWPADWQVPSGAAFLIGHNIDYDWAAIGSPGVRRICTLALARKAWPKLDSHALSALIYHLYPPKMAREMVRNAHSAAADIQLTHEVLYTLWDAAGKPDWEKLWLISEEARIPTVMPFGKHKGVPIKQVPRDYIDWLRRQPDVDPYVLKAFER